MRVRDIKLPKTNVLPQGSGLNKGPDTDAKMAQEHQDADEIHNPGLEQDLPSLPDLPLLGWNLGEDSGSDQYEDPVDGGRGDPQADDASGGSDSSVDLYQIHLIPEEDRMDDHQVDAFIVQNQSKFQ